jgi:hypothetical protein
LPEIQETDASAGLLFYFIGLLSSDLLARNARNRTVAVVILCYTLPAKGVQLDAICAALYAEPAGPGNVRTSQSRFPTIRVEPMS